MISERARTLHHSSVVVDTHADSIGRAVDDGEDLGQETGRGHLDLPRMKRGNLTAEFFACFAHPRLIKQRKSIQRVLDMADAVKQLCASYPDEIGVARTAADIRQLASAGKRSAVLCVEGGHAIEDDLAVLRQFHELGFRSMTLTWNNTNNWADGVLDVPRNNGLSDFGRQVIREMNRLGMLVDVSHASVKTFWDVMETTSKPIIASHSSAWAICQHPRNLNDDQVRAVGQSGGVVCTSFVSPFVSESFRQQVDTLDRRRREEWTEAKARYAGDEKAEEDARQ